MHPRNPIQSLFWGIIAAGMSLIFQLMLISFLFALSADRINNFSMNSFYFLIIFALTEESFKYFIITKKINLISYGRGFLINAWTAGIGFSLLEIFIIYQKNIQENNNLSLIELSQTAPLHILTFGILGYQISTQDKKYVNFSALFIVSLVHFAYNFAIINLEKYEQYAVWGILALLLATNMYYFLIINKKLASD